MEKNVFNNISKSEITHTESIKTLLDAYEINDPFIEGVGEFTNKDLSALYDQLTVYENLQRGSRNHLRAFVKNLNNYGEDYSPSYISKEEFNLIISGENEIGQGSSGNQDDGSGLSRGSGYKNIR
ncbi:MAG: DUF2202 domain-containing protein [Candidatus Dojkabacteria bacterium]|nr:DUF2202 domain-containing protein [Candidatus Dojkabacteria bacterium]